MGWRHRHSGFTLIELLTVIAIISLLIAILLPALSGAREQSRAVVCLANLKQITAAFCMYSHDFGVIPGTYWQGPINLDWSGRMNAEYQEHPERYRHPLETSVLRPYLSSVDKILECPTAKREANKFYDYTVIIRMAGARTDLPWVMTWPENPKQPVPSRRQFTALPLLIEEDYYFYNHGVTDGSWANYDQITDRHRRYANLGYLDGSASRFKSPKGPNPEREELDDLIARHLRLWVGTKAFEVWYSNETEFGWANQPK
jgi:prepilin-type N-terminal cleavage/methylation domain-containing protein/prepilin-type processing-associated H-X9-DG protein